MATSKPLIALDSVTFAYDETPIVEKATLSIERGSFVGVIGPNGGGKTTLLRLLMGFLKPQEGSCTVMGKAPEKMRAKMGYVPQVLSFDKAFPITLLEVVMLGAIKEKRSVAKERAKAALEKVDLLEKRESAFGSLSGGEVQRALIARALASKPEIIFLDEPTASIDYESEKKLYELLESLKGQHTLIMVSHNLPAIIERVDRVLCVQKTITAMAPDAVCEHYAYGLYHSPLKKESK